MAHLKTMTDDMQERILEKMPHSHTAGQQWGGSAAASLNDPAQKFTAARSSSIASNDSLLAMILDSIPRARRHQ